MVLHWPVLGGLVLLADGIDRDGLLGVRELLLLLSLANTMLLLLE